MWHLTYLEGSFGRHWRLDGWGRSELMKSRGDKSLYNLLKLGKGPAVASSECERDTNRLFLSAARRAAETTRFGRTATSPRRRTRSCSSSSPAGLWTPPPTNRDTSPATNQTHRTSLLRARPPASGSLWLRVLPSPRTQPPTNCSPRSRGRRPRLPRSESLGGRMGPPRRLLLRRTPRPGLSRSSMAWWRPRSPPRWNMSFSRRKTSVAVALFSSGEGAGVTAVTLIVSACLL